MARKSPTQLFLPVFGGQGTLTVDSASSFKLSSFLASSSSADVLLSACHAALHTELAALDQKLCDKVGICTSAFKDKASLLRPENEQQSSNPAFAGPVLLLNQVLRYLSFIEKANIIADSINPFADALRCNSDFGVGVMGFSSGILSACVVASSPSTLLFISHAVEAYRLALWIGIRVQIYRAGLYHSPLSMDERPWALVVVGIDKESMQDAIDCFNQSFDIDPIHLTAVIDVDCLTISGHPDYLALFVKSLSDGVTVHETKISALYHCPSQLKAVRTEVLADIISRKIHFPNCSDLLVPIRSTFSGNLISSDEPAGSLVELVVDMVLTQPVNWDLVVEKVATSLPLGISITLVSIGLGTTLLKGFKNNISLRGPSPMILDLASDEMSHKHNAKQEPVAIIGMAINMPGAPNLDKLWELLENGSNTVQEIPEGRFYLSDYVDCRTGRSIKTRTGNFIRDIDEFDHNPREARNMDPQQRILLRVGYEALEDSGYVPHGSPSFDPATFGCYIGSATHDYAQNLKNDIDVYYSTGTLKAFLSGRLSYCLGLSGPSLVVDTACSSSMVAIYQACRALMNRDCHAALAGGVNVISSPDMFIGLDRGHFLSPSGQCKPFDASADGYSRGEGCGIFVLKRLSDAIAENDRILGIIRGVEVNQSGNATSITHPHSPTQEALFKQILRHSDIDPNSVNVVEAHGTGTQAGDTNELESIRRVLAAEREPDNPLYVTSIKANIGHLEAASGCSSLAKVLLMLRHRVIPQQISLQTLNPRIAPLASDNTVITTINLPWLSPRHEKPRIALVNNFGAAGSNAALLVEEHIFQVSLSMPSSGTSFPFGLSAKDRPTLEALRSKYMTWLKDSRNQAIPLLDIAYTTTARRQIYPYRLAIPACSTGQLFDKLGTASIVNVTDTMPSIVFVFSGQGHQYRGMGSSLYATSSIFRRHVQECDSILTAHGFTGVISAIVGVPSQVTNDNEEELQSATFSLQYSLAKLWISWGIKPLAVLGHSLGEYAALVIAGVLGLQDGLLFVATRARLMFQRCQPMTTGMVAVSLEPVKLQPILDLSDAFTNISISCFNSPGHCVVSGPLEELDELKLYLEKKNISKATQLRVPYGYHSSSMLPAASDLVTLSGKLRTYPTHIPFISTALGRVIMPGDWSFPSQDYFARQCVEPVRLTEGIESYLSLFSGMTTWLEISSHPSVLPMLRSFSALSDSSLLGSLHENEDSWFSLSKTLTSLYLGNYTVNWQQVFIEIGPATCINLPSYPFASQKFWVPFVETSSTSHPRLRTKFAFIKGWLQFPNNSNDEVAIFQTPITQLKHYIKGHRVGGVPLCPASVYLEVISATISLAMEYMLQENDFEIALRQISLPNPLTWNYGDHEGCAMLLVVVDTSRATFVVKSQLSLSEPEVIHATGEYFLRSQPDTRKELVCFLPSLTRRIDAILKPENGQAPETFSTRTIYQVIFPRVVEYSADFHTLESLSMLSGGMEATGRITLSRTCDAGSFFAHPLFCDTLVHIAGFISNLRGGQNDAYICNEIGSIQLTSATVRAGASYTIYCKIFPVQDESSTIGESFAISDSKPQTLIARITGIHFQRVRLTSLETGLASVSGMLAPRSLGQNLGGGSSKFPLPSNVMATVIRIVAKACNVGIQNIAVRQDLNSLGIDSLMRIELSYDLSKAFPGFGCRPQELGTCKDIMEIVKTILSVADSTSCFDVSSPASSSGILSTPRTLAHSKNESPSMRRIVARILDIEEDAINDDTQLSTLGLDSLSSIEAIHTLRQEYHLNVPGNLVACTRTMRELESQVLKLEPSYFPSSPGGQGLSDHISRNPFLKSCRNFQSKALSLFQNPESNLDRTSLVLIHDGSGLTLSYERISNLHRRVWTIRNPRFASSEPWASISHMAHFYASLILEEMEGPVLLGGWSFGGVVAFEVAKQLQARSMTVKGVILIDSPSPLMHVPLPPSLIDQVLDASGNIEPELRELCKIQFATNAQLLDQYKPGSIRKDENFPLVFLMCSEPYNPPNHGDVPSWLSERSETTFIVGGWESITGNPLTLLKIPGHHFQPFDLQNVVAVSERIAEACSILDTKSTR